MTHLPKAAEAEKAKRRTKRREAAANQMLKKKKRKSWSNNWRKRIKTKKK